MSLRFAISSCSSSGAYITRVAFAAPPGIRWTLPAYELALLTASFVADRHLTGIELAIVTPEGEPLAAFGPTAGRALRDLLGDRGIRLHVNATAERLPRDLCGWLRARRSKLTRWWRCPGSRVRGCQDFRQTSWDSLRSTTTCVSPQLMRSTLPVTERPSPSSRAASLLSRPTWQSR